MQLLQSGEHPKINIDVCDVTIRKGVESRIPLSSKLLAFIAVTA